VGGNLGRLYGSPTVEDPPILVNRGVLSDWMWKAVDAPPLPIAATSRILQVVFIMPHKLVNQLVEFWLVVLIW
jgi:hypothetical protein